jgi:hypothetical protein
MFGKELKAVVKSECGSKDFGTALQFLSVNPCEAECLMIEKAVKGVGTDEFLLITIICGRTNQEMQLLKKTYFNLHTKDLGKKLDSELGGDLEQLVFNALQADEKKFDPDYHTKDRAKEDAKKLHDMGQGRWGTNEAGLFKLIIASPPKYVTMVNSEYADKYGYTLPKALEKELGGQVEDAALFLIGMKLKPIETIAGLIDKACKGIGTNELLLTTVLIRYQSVLPQVKIAHQELYGQSIEDRVKKEVRGDYESLLVRILEAADK